MLRLGDWYNYSNSFSSQASDGEGWVASDIVSNANRILGHPVPVYMSSWSPPAFLKSNGQVGNGGTLIYTNGGYAYTNFAQYWYDSLVAYKAEGVAPTWISLQNEPDFVATYASCRFDPTEDTVNGTNYASYSKALIATYNLLTNLLAPPLLLAPECVGLGFNDVQNYAATMNGNYFYGLAHHLYGGSTDGSPDGYRATMLALGSVFPVKPKFMTEFGYSNMVQTACLIHDCFTVEQASGFNYWSLVWPAGGDGLVQIENPYTPQNTWTNAPPGIPETHGYWLSPSFWAVKHFSYFINPGYVRVGATNTDSNSRVSAYLSPDNERLVVVLINTNAADFSTITLNPGSFAAARTSVYQTVGNSTWQSLGALTNSQVLPPLSLTTVVLTAQPRIQSAQLAGNSKIALAGTSGSLSGATFYTLSSTNLASPLTNWTVVATNQFGPGGGFSSTNPFNAAQSQQYFILSLP